MSPSVTDEAPEVQIIKVIEVRFKRGLGIKGDPVRQVKAYYWADNGDLLVEVDPAALISDTDR